MSNRRKSKWDRQAQADANRVGLYPSKPHNHGGMARGNLDGPSTMTLDANHPVHQNVVVHAPGSDVVVHPRDEAEVREHLIEQTARIHDVPRKLLESPAHTYKNLAEGVANDERFVSVLRDPSVGHKAVAEQYPFTSESSVRRWRKANGVVLS